MDKFENFDGFDPLDETQRGPAFHAVVDLFQEYDCPTSGIDFDLNDGAIVASGESFYCSCGERHIGGTGGPDQTVAVLLDGAMEFWPLPKDAEEKASWLAAKARNTKKA